MAYDLPDNLGRTGDVFGRMAEPIAANYPYMTIPGNHENYNNATAYKARYNMPRTFENQGTDTFFSFSLGRASYIMFDTETFTGLTDEGAKTTQINWLREQLELANFVRDTHPWLIVLSHHPLYCGLCWSLPDFCADTEDGVGHAESIFQETYEVIQPLLEEMFNKYAVDIYF
jgi:3',5'-cyclic AMP phosphodiesterase CpdA